MHKQPHFIQKAEEKTAEVNGDKNNERGAGFQREGKRGVDGDHDRKSSNDKKSSNGTGAAVVKPLSMPEQTHSAPESTSAVKTSYNPITHITSEFCLIVVVQWHSINTLIDVHMALVTEGPGFNVYDLLRIYTTIE